MILPTKHLPLERTLLAAGAQLLGCLDRPLTVSGLWDRVRREVAFPSFDHLVLALDVLFALGMVDLEEGKLKRRRPE
jgi:hypothetical protein